MTDAGAGQSRYADLQLTPLHERLLIASAIAPDVAKARPYRSIVRGSSVLDACGFSRDQQILTPGLLIRLHPLLDGPGAVHHQYRPDHPRADAKGKLRKYETPAGTRLTIDAHPFLRERGWLDDPQVVLLFTEGLRKVDSAISKGFCTLGFLGVWGFCGTNPKGGKAILPDLREIPMNDRLVLIAYDSDAATNPGVLQAAREFGQYIAAKGGHAEMPVIPPGSDGAKVGLDDYLAQHSREEYLALPRIDLTANVNTSSQAPPETQAPTLSLPTFETVQASSVQWAAVGRIPLGEASFLTGVPGIGKSALSYDYAARWSRGQVEGALFGTPCDVVLATAEDDLSRVVKPRLIAAGADCSRVHPVHVKLADGEEGALLLPRDLAALEREMQQLGARILLLDPLLSFLDVAQVNVWRETLVRPTMLQIIAMARRLEAAIWAILHMNKSQLDQLMFRVAHSAAFTQVMRAGFMVVPDPMSPGVQTARCLYHLKHNLGPKSLTMRFHTERRIVEDHGASIETVGIVWGAETDEIQLDDLRTKNTRGPAPKEQQNAAAFLVQALAGGPRPMTVILAEALKAGISPRTLYRARATLRIVTTKDNEDSIWSLPE